MAGENRWYLKGKTDAANEKIASELDKRARGCDFEPGSGMAEVPFDMVLRAINQEGFVKHYWVFRKRGGGKAEDVTHFVKKWRKAKSEAEAIRKLEELLKEIKAMRKKKAA